MKKHLHGKRHVYARRSVAIGRGNKRVRKLNRWFSLMKRYDWKGLIERMAEAISKVTDTSILLQTLDAQERLN